MPRQAIDYSKTVIYKIVCRDLTIEDCYVGSTTDFRNRKNVHKSHCKTKNLKLYEFINSNGGWDNWTMIEIEKYICIDSNEMRARERYWAEELNADLNTRKAITSNEEKKEYTNNYMKDHNKKYYLENAEKLKMKQKENYYKNK
jgi:hypothetical protein